MKFALLALAFVSASVAPIASAQTCGAGGTYTVAGSSTVFPISEEISKAYVRKCTKSVSKVEAGGSGSGAKRVCAVDGAATAVDVGNLSRDWKATEATKLTAPGFDAYKCAAGDVSRVVLRVPVGIDGVSMILGKDGKTFSDCISQIPGQSLTPANLRYIYSNSADFGGAASTRTWNVVNSNCPNQEIKAAAPSSTFGTYDFFKEVILNVGGESFRNGIAYFDDNSPAIQTYVLNTPYSIAFVGYSFFNGNRNTLATTAINGKFPTKETLSKDEYLPLGRRIYSNYLNTTASLAKTKCFSDFHFTTSGSLIVEATGFVSIPDDEFVKNKALLPGKCGSCRCGFIRKLFGLCPKC